MEKTLLQKFLARISKRMTVEKIMSTPRTFEDVRGEQFGWMSSTHFIMEICSDWIEKLPRRVDEWIRTIDEYMSEFRGSWEYYACSKRLESIGEYGPDERDLDENGEVRTSGLTRDDLRCHTVFRDLYLRDIRDVLQDFIPDDMVHFTSSVFADSKLDVKKMLSEMAGKEMDTYIVDRKNGEMRPETFGEHEMNRITDSVRAEDEMKMMALLGHAVYRMCRKLENVHEDVEFSDSREFLWEFRQDCLKLRDMRLNEMSVLESAIICAEDAFL